jgi:hypothetical protein
MLSRIKRRHCCCSYKIIAYTHIDLPPLVSIEATGACILIGRNDILLAAAYKPPGQVWSEAGIIELLNLRSKSLLARNLQTKNPA